MQQRNKKAPKSDSTGKPKKSTDENSWREALDGIAINDEEWWCIVTMMVETITEHSRCVSLFNAAAEEGRRRAIYSLSCQKTLASVRALSKQSLDKCPTIQGVCHYASKALNGDSDTLPSWLMARVIKYLIYRAREENLGIVKRLADLEREIDEEYWIMQTVADWGQPGTKEFNAEKFDRKANTRLRKRDEEWRDTVYVDDAPIKGPNFYVILTGFHDPDLPEHLINSGVPLHCMLQIKRPNEHLDRLVQYETVVKDTTETKRLQFLEDYVISGIKLFEFWTKVENRLLHPDAHPEYCDIGFVTFCPPRYPETSNDDEYSIQKEDIYDRVSYIVYDFYDLYRQHGNYLKSMKIEQGIVTGITEHANLDSYTKFLDAFPMECVSVPIILFAMLRQIEENEGQMTTENPVDEKGDAKVVGQDRKDTTMGREIAGESLEADAESPVIDIAPLPTDPEVALIEEKVKTLNDKYHLDFEESQTEDNEQKITDIELTLHGNTLLEAIRFLDSSAIATISHDNANELIDCILPIFRRATIMNLYEENRISEKKLNDYSRHLDNIRGYFNAQISDEEIRHYLHILVFDRMIFGSTKPTNGSSKGTAMDDGRDSMRTERLTSSVKRGNSLPSLMSKSTMEIHVLSDGSIDYGKMVPEIVECSPLFDLIDPRELLVPGYLMENVLKKRAKEMPRLEDFSDVEILARRIFPQLLHECLLSFDHVEFRYFEPTDCLLLYFGNKWRINGVREEERMSSIRTPIRLRDFCKYVAPEEKDWLRREEELYRLQTAGWMERLMRKSTEIYEETMLFRDEDFILPGTLKARDLEKRKELDKQRNTEETGGKSEETIKSGKKGAEKVFTGNEEKKGGKMSDKKSNSKKLATDEESPLPSRRVSITDNAKEEAAYDFIGYELARLRVEITNRKSTFYSADDTLVHVEIDDWLYQHRDIRINVTLSTYSLRLFHRIDSPETNDAFHLTSKTGIILAFQKKVATQGEPEIPFRCDWQNMDVQFRASWPTGLMIEPITGDGPENPYYIQQSYILRGCIDSGGNREIRRKFLRNGTVLKYLDNGNIIVLRPNGVIVTCTAFEKQHVETEKSLLLADASKSLADTLGNPSGRQSKLSSKVKKKYTGSMHQMDGAGESGSGQQHSALYRDSVLSMEDYGVRVSRYTVLNHDGERYEVADDLIVSEQHRLLVRMASDYEVDEKFTRRADGTNMLLNSNGELIVRFPDGTRITTGYTIEKEPAMCDWTEDDILRYFTSDGTKEEEDTCADVSFFDLGSAREACSRRHAEYEGKMAELLITDSFVSVLLTCRAEHKNYATVSYDQSAVSCTLSMHDDLRVSISRRGHYEVSMAEGVNLKISEDTLTFEGNACTICGSQSMSTYKLLPLDMPSVIFKTTDLFGNVFEVRNDGTTRYYPKSETSRGRNGSTNLGSLESNNDEVYYTEDEEGDECSEEACSHDALCFKDNNRAYRIFAVNRNLTAYEYIHRSVRNQVEMLAAFDDSTSVISYPSLHRAKLQRLITYEPVGNVSRAKAILSFPDFQVKPTNYDRRDLLRSTYSIPYDWLFPFGRNGDDGVRKDTHDHPLMNYAQTLPELLRIRIMRAFKEPNENAVIDLQRALGHYWMSIVRGIAEARSTAVGDDKEMTRERGEKSLGDYTEDKLYSLALGVKKTIDVETYKIGLERPWKLANAGTRRKSPAFMEFLRHKAETEELLQWYKRCMREKFILPYFRNITGTCFLWVMDCIRNAFDVLAAKSSSCECSSTSL